MMAVDVRAAVARDMLRHRHDAGGHEPLHHGAAEEGDDLGIGAEGAVADHVVGAGQAEVEHRRAVDVDTQRAELHGEQACIEPHCLRRPVAVAAGELAEACGGRRGAPLRRLQPGDAAAFLVDQHRRVAPHRLAQIGDQTRDLRRRFDVAQEDDEAERIGGAEEAPFGIGERRSGAAVDRSGLSHGFTTRQA
jgi:hypothetical protein